MKKIILGLIIVGFPTTSEAITFDLNSDEITISVPGNPKPHEASQKEQPSKDAEPEAKKQSQSELQPEPYKPNTVYTAPIYPDDEAKQTTQPKKKKAIIPKEKQPLEPTDLEPKHERNKKWNKQNAIPNKMPDVINYKKKNILPPPTSSDSELYLGQLMSTLATTINA